jgi:hypothetical protein
MAEPSIDIDRVVREVLAEMGLAPQASPPLAATSAAARPSDEELVVSARVVTMSDLGDRIERVRRVVVPMEAVVTPAVRDALRRTNIALVYEQPRPQAATGTARLVIVMVGQSFDPAGLVTALRKDGMEAALERSDCLVAASDELARSVADGRTLGVMLTSQPAAGLCVANRLPGVRAVLGTDAAETAAAVASVGANVLVVAPRSKTFFQLKYLVRQFGRGGVRPCPDALKERLA